MLVVLALGAAVFYGAGDFLGGFAARRAHALTVALVAQAIGFVALLAVLPFFPGTILSTNLLWGVPAGIFGGAGIALFYHALSVGKMGVLSPVTAVLAAAIPVVVGLLLGEHLSLTQGIGIFISLLAIALISFSLENGVREISTAGMREAILAGIAFGGFYVFLGFAWTKVGLNELAVARITSIVLLAAVTRFGRISFTGVAASRGPIVAAGLTDMAANVLYVLATFSGLLSLAAVLTSLYPATTVALARIVLKERLNTSQWIGALLALAGVVLIAWRS